MWNHTYCIPTHQHCDKVDDCIDKSDEEGCYYRTCLEEDHKCGSGLCIPPTKKCDGYFDCRDESDESGCNMTSCAKDKFRCNNKCIEKSHKCDHRNDCGDNSDEQECNFPACHEDQFRCANALCIPRRWHCDGHKDCPDGSDEDNCTAIACPDSKFLCPKEQRCIEKSKLCNNERDCDDGSDETTACLAVLCPSLGCEYVCRASLVGGQCYCPPGKQVSNDTRTCIDKNECEEWGHCDQHCVNTDGSYKCMCTVGFMLQDNTRVLKMPDIAGKEPEVVVNATAASGLDYHYKKDLLYWSDTETRKVYSQKLRGTGTPSETIIALTLPGSLTPGALAVDWVGDKIYVVDILGQKIDVFEILAPYHAIVLSSNITEPQDIGLDPTKGLMFVADTDRIIRANMDGTNLKALVKDVIYKASGIAVDIISQRIFWCDSLLDYIETVTYDGTGRTAIVRGSTVVPAPNRLTMFES
ncbi:hypothetical protein Pmani_021642 [Petrolisthes manimaculis]|uniref:Uncharacterized protein n=1 Tax=Petrolisthes manimaculis TaxID=1843537 RepID=A0AAE1PDQ4_9EUCA|nr:hypothetical protein Pmani_021642 [Petrolisthes manimaculis]